MAVSNKYVPMLI